MPAQILASGRVHKIEADDIGGTIHLLGPPGPPNASDGPTVMQDLILIRL